jgi:hypothetical protein
MNDYNEDEDPTFSLHDFKKWLSKEGMGDLAENLQETRKEESKEEFKERFKDKVRRRRKK